MLLCYHLTYLTFIKLYIVHVCALQRHISSNCYLGTLFIVTEMFHKVDKYFNKARE